MKCEVRVLPEAREDLKKIEDYYMITFDIETALKVTDHILNVLERLEEFPGSGSLLPGRYLNEKGYRMVICRQHAAFYRQIVEVVYICHIADTRTEHTKLFES